MSDLTTPPLAKPKATASRAKKSITSAKDLDYSAIPRQQRWTTIRYVTVGLGISALTCITIAVLGGIGIGVGSSSDSILVGLTSLIVMVNSILIIPLVIATVVAGIIMALTTNDFLGKHLPSFATANGFTAQPSNFSLNKDGSIFSVGDSPSESNIVTGNYRGFEFELFEHSYWTGSGKSRSQHRLSILNIKLPKKVPHLVIDSKIEDATAYSGSVLPVTFDSKQKLTLEGDFSKYFNVYSPRHYQVSALALLTPDVMQTFLTKLHQVDVELVGDRLYIYDPDVMNSSEQIADMFEAADAVIDEWSAKLKRANIYATKQQEQIHTGDGAQPVRLKRGGLVLTVIIVIVFLTFQLLNFLGETTNNPIFAIPFAFIVPVVLIILIVNIVIVARRRIAFSKRYGKIKD